VRLASGDRTGFETPRQHADEHHRKRVESNWLAGMGVDRVTSGPRAVARPDPSIATETGGDLEIFVHGRVRSYSGQCFSSEAWAGRSANRGQCAQACRLPYKCWWNGGSSLWATRANLLSPGDLYALRQIREMVAAGIAALKIEGRYKDADTSPSQREPTAKRG